MQRHSRLLAPIFALLLDAACGDDGGSGTDSAGSTAGSEGSGSDGSGGNGSDGSGVTTGPAGPIPEDDAATSLARVLCRLMFEVCECSQNPFGSEEACVAATSQQLAGSFQEAMGAGLVYDAACMGEVLDYWNVTVQCKTLDELAGQPSGPPCKAYSGTAALGEACTNYYQVFGDTCEPGITCLNGTCQAIAAPTAKKEGEACSQTDLCEAGTFCLPPTDEPQGALTCVRLPGLGEPCQVGCDVGLNCEFVDGMVEGTCAEPPGSGEPCGSFPYECAQGLYCGYDDVTLNEACLPTLPAGTPCFGDEACGVGFECEDPPEGGERVCLAREAMVCI